MLAESSIRNFFSGTLYSVLSLAVGLVVTPIVVRHLGADDFGLYRVLIEWLAYLSLIELGLNEGALAIISQSRGAKSSRFRAAIRASVEGFWRIVPVKVVIGVAFVYFAPRITGSGTHDDREVQIAMAIGLISSLFSFLSPYRTALEVMLKTYIVNYLLIFQSLLTATLSLISIWQNWGLAGQIFAASLGSVSINVFAFIITKIHLRKEAEEALSTPSEGQGTREIIRSFGSVSFYGLITSVCSRLTSLSDSIFISLLIHPTAVTSFYLGQRLVQICQGQLLNVGNSSWAALADLYRSGQKDAFSEKLAELTKLITTFGFCIMTPVLFINRAFVARWVGEDNLTSHWIPMVAAFNAVIMALVAQWCWIFSTTGKQSLLVKQMIIQTLLNVALTWVLTVHYGPIGPLLGTAIAYSLTSFWIVPLLLHKHFAVEWRVLWGSMVRPTIFLLPPTAALLIFRLPAKSSWVEIFIALAGSSILIFAIAIFFVWDRNERNIWRERFARMLPKSKIG